MTIWSHLQKFPAFGQGCWNEGMLAGPGTREQQNEGTERYYLKGAPRATPRYTLRAGECLFKITWLGQMQRQKIIIKKKNCPKKLAL